MANVVDLLLRANTGNAGKQLDTLGVKLNKLSGGAMKFAGSLGIAFGAAGIIAAGRNALDLADTMEKLERKIGVSTEALSELKFAGEQSGIGFEVLTKALEKMSNNVSEAALGTGEAQKAIQELGLSAEALKNLKPEEQLEVFADAFEGVKNTSDKTRLAIDLFGQRGSAMIQIMGGGSTAIKELRDEAHGLGLTLSHESAVGAADAADAMNVAKSAFNGLALESTINLAPAITEIATGLAEVIPQAAQLASTAFFTVRKVGLETVSALAAAYAGFSFKMSELLQKVGFTGEAEKALNNAAVLSAFSIKLMDSAAGAATVLQGKVEDVTFTMSEAHSPAVELVNRNYGILAVTAGEAGEALREAVDPKFVEEFGDVFQVQLGDRSQNIFHQVADNFRGMLNQMLNDLISSQVSSWVGSLFGGLIGGGAASVGSGVLMSSGLGGATESAIKSFSGVQAGSTESAISSFFGGQAHTGGSFVVPKGNGGRDGSLVTLAADPGETVSVMPKGQQQGGGTVVTFNNQYDFRGSSLERSEVESMINSSQKVTEAQIHNNMRRGRF